MLRGLIISPDSELCDRLAQALNELGTVTVGRVVNEYPSGGDLARLVRATSPQVVFLSAESLTRAAAVLKDMEAVGSGIQIIAINRECSPQSLLEVMRLGIREYLALPFHRQSVFEAVQRIGEQLSKRPAEVATTEHVYSFLPSKAGVGTSTLALNVSVAMSRLGDTRVVLGDFDLNSGMMRFMLKLTNEYSVADACEHASGMDESLWPQLVTNMGALDVLHAGRLNPHLRIEPTQIRYLTDFLRRNYQALCFDLSGNLEKYSIELMHESKRVFLVCTPEIPSLHLAREKYQFLRTLDLEGRVSVLVNRAQKRQLISNDQIEQILGLPVSMIFPNDYQSVHKAVTIGRWVDFETDLGKHIQSFANSLLRPAKGQAGAPAAKSKFLDFFSVPTKVKAS